MRSKIRWFTEFCNSHYLSHFAAFFIDARTKRSVVESFFNSVELRLRFTGFGGSLVGTPLNAGHQRHPGSGQQSGPKPSRGRPTKATPGGNQGLELGQRPVLGNDPSAGSLEDG